MPSSISGADEPNCLRRADQRSEGEFPLMAKMNALLIEHV
jgi:hypothetical protein